MRLPMRFRGLFGQFTPTLAWFIIRTFEIVRQYFDRFYMMFDPDPANAGWVSVGYVIALGVYCGNLWAFLQLTQGCLYSQH